MTVYLSLRMGVFPSASRGRPRRRPSAVTGRPGSCIIQRRSIQVLPKREAYAMLIRLLGVRLNPILKRQGKTLLIVRKRR